MNDERWCIKGIEAIGYGPTCYGQKAEAVILANTLWPTPSIEPMYFSQRANNLYSAIPDDANHEQAIRFAMNWARTHWNHLPRRRIMTHEYPKPVPLEEFAWSGEHPIWPPGHPALTEVRNFKVTCMAGGSAIMTGVRASIEDWCHTHRASCGGDHKVEPLNGVMVSDGNGRWILQQEKSQ